MKVIVAGSGGFLGKPLVSDLRTAGHEVTRLVRREPGTADEIAWSPVTGTIGTTGSQRCGRRVP